MTTSEALLLTASVLIPSLILFLTVRVDLILPKKPQEYKRQGGPRKS